MKHAKMLFILLIAASLASCNFSQNSTNQTSQVEAKTLIVADFNADSAYQYVNEQVAFGPRVPGSKSHSQCLDYLRNTLQRFGAEVTIQEGEGTAYDGQRIAIRNVIAKYLPDKANRIILCSHWDSRPFADHDPDKKRRDEPIDGANDGASGVGILLEAARQFNLKQPQIGVDIIFFDVEDYGTPDHKTMKEYRADTWCLGSQFWAKSKLGKNCEARFGILLDMVGAPEAQFYHEKYSTQYASEVVQKVWRTASEIGHGNRFAEQEAGYITDDHFYVNSLTDVPCIDIIHLEPQSGSTFGKYWHTHNDTMENIDKQTLAAVGETILTVVYNEK